MREALEFTLVAPPPIPFFANGMKPGSLSVAAPNITASGLLRRNDAPFCEDRQVVRWFLTTEMAASVVLC
jgi:hypothetical protein